VASQTTARFLVVAGVSAHSIEVREEAVLVAPHLFLERGSALGKGFARPACLSDVQQTEDVNHE